MTSTKFIHIADIHLGKRQYNNAERYKDYFRAFKWILSLALREKVDFVLISGDLFDNRKVGPSVLIQVFHIITHFKTKCQEELNRDIPLICIEGNHDNPIFSKQSWMSFLADLELIILLSGDFDRNTKQIEFISYDKRTHRGGMFQINNVKIYGLPFYGSSTIHLFEPIHEAIEKDASNFNILMMHFGVEGQDSSKPGVNLTERFETLHEKVDYLALGHYHKQYKIPSREPWIFNPGSLEVNDLKEIFENYERGAFIGTILGMDFRYESIECDNGADEPRMIPNRMFKKVSTITVNQTNSFPETIDHVLDIIGKWVPEKGSDMASDKDDLNCPILFFNLEGDINYSRLDVNINQLRKEIMDKFAILEVRIFSNYLISTLDDIRIPDENKTMEEIEYDVFSAMVGGNALFEQVKEEVVELMKNLKTELLGRNPDTITLKDLIKDWCLNNASNFNLPADNYKPIKVNLKEVDKGQSESKMDVKKREILEDDLDDFIDDIKDDSN